MSTANRPYPVVQDLIESFASWLKHRRELNEMRQLDRSDFNRIASDLRVSPDDLEELVRHGRHAADELPKMLEQLMQLLFHQITRPADDKAKKAGFRRLAEAMFDKVETQSRRAEKDIWSMPGRMFTVWASCFMSC